MNSSHESHNSTLDKTQTPRNMANNTEEDYILSVNAINTGAISRFPTNGKNVREEMREAEERNQASALPPRRSSRHNSRLPTGTLHTEADEEKTMEELLAEFATLRSACENMRMEFRALDMNVADVEKRVVDLQEGVEDMEIKLRFEISDQIKSFRELNENRHRNLEDRWARAVDDMVATNEKTVGLCEKMAQRNSQDFKNINARQLEVEERVRTLGTQREERATPPNRQNTFKLSPKTPSFAENYSPMKFLSELQDFWAAMRPSQEETAFVIGSCLKGAPKDWWDLVKEDNDTIETFHRKFKDRYWNDNTQHEVRRKLEFGHYTATSDNSMTIYVIKIFRDAKNLTPPLSDSEIIKRLSRHFNEEIRTTILGRQIQKLSELLELLDRFDSSGPLNSRRGDNTDTKNENWRNKTHRNEADKPHPQKREENWRSKEKNAPATNRAIRALNLSEEKGTEGSEEGENQIQNTDSEN